MRLVPLMHLGLHLTLGAKACTFLSKRIAMNSDEAKSSSVKPEAPQ